MRTTKTLKSVLAVSALLVGLTLGLASNSQAADNKAKNGTLEQKVEHNLAMLPYYSVFDDLAFRIDGSHVTLLGEVSRPSLKSDAEGVVKHIEGVTSVTNNIEVLPLSPFDNQIRRAEFRAIYGDPQLSRYGLGSNKSIHIIVNNGHVTLVGVVSTDSDRNVANIRANSVPGVFSVTNNLAVQHG